MNLGNIKNLCFGNIGRYGDTNANDIALMEQNVNLAIDEVKLNTLIAALIQTTTLVTQDRSATLNPTYSVVVTDFDVPVIIRYIDSNGDQWDMTMADAQTIRSLVPDLRETGRPEVFRINGNTAGIVDIDFHLITRYAGESIVVEYLPIIAEVSLDPDENLIMKKYAPTIIKLATGYSFHNIIQNFDQGDKWIAKGMADFTKIGSREMNGPAYNKLPTPVAKLREARQNRRTI